MKSYVLAIRAIGSEFGGRLWTQFLPIFIGTAILLMVLQLWLASLNTWWWLLVIPISIFIGVGLVIGFVFRMLISYVRPAQTPDQRVSVPNFVDKLQFVNEVTGTPKIIVLFRVIRSIAAPSSDSYLKDIVETKTLRADFQAITRDFTS
jgi:hypothetical protein